MLLEGLATLLLHLILVLMDLNKLLTPSISLLDCGTEMNDSSNGVWFVRRSATAFLCDLIFWLG